MSTNNDTTNVEGNTMARAKDAADNCKSHFRHSVNECGKNSLGKCSGCCGYCVMVAGCPDACQVVMRAAGL